MTIEIKELVIKAVIDESTFPSPQPSNELDEQAIVAMCVEQVLAILERESQR